MNKKIFAAVKMFALFLTMFFLGACSGPSSNGPIYQMHPENPAFGSVENELRAVSLSCDSPGNCPESVGMVYSRSGVNNGTKPQTLQCTGFLVQNNIVATNSHCLPDMVKQNQISCGRFMAIKFIRRQQGRPEIFPCLRILNYSLIDPKKISPDYAFFEISSTGILPLSISQDGISNRQQLRVVKIVPTENGGRLQTESCVSSLNSALNLGSASPWSKTSVAINCRSVHGNSGAPVLNKNNQVLGILQSAFEEKQLQEIKRIAPPGTQIPERLIPHFIWTNFACVPHPVSGSYQKSKCDAAENLQLTDCVERDLSTAMGNEMKVDEDWGRRLPKYFLYEFQTDLNRKVKRAVPSCVRSGSPENISANYIAEINFAMPLHFDNEFRLTSKTNFLKKSETNYSVNLVKSGEVWTGNFFPYPGNTLSKSPGSIGSAVNLTTCSLDDERRGSTARIIGASSDSGNSLSNLNKKDISLCSKD